jgi:hypothetical protein
MEQAEFGHLRNAGAEILAAGVSNWVVYPMNGKSRRMRRMFCISCGDEQTSETNPSFFRIMGTER